MSQKLKGIILDRSTLGSVEIPSELLSFCDWEFRDFTASHETQSVIKECDVVLTNKVILGEEELYNSNVKYIGILATGTNNVDLNFCSENNIEVKNAVGYSTQSVTQHTFTMLFGFLGSIGFNDAYTKNGYSQSKIFTHFGSEYQEIKGKTWGIIGLGNIGRNVADVATAFGANVVYHSTSGVSRSDKYKMVSLDELLKESDIISIHAPFNEKTDGLINSSTFKKMSKKPVLLNLGRGGIVVEEDLIQALNSGELSGACLDVFEEEPFNFEMKYSKLVNKNKVLLSPHIAWASVEARQELLKITTNNLSSWINKRKG